MPLLVIAAVSGVGAYVALGVDDILSGLSGFVIANLLAGVIMGALLWAFDRRFGLGLADDLGRVFPRVAAFVGHSRLQSTRGVGT